jgi:hypothetical protein
MIFPFEISGINKKFDYSLPTEIVFQKITAPDLHEIIQKKPFTWLLVCASWCPVSEKAILKYSELSRLVAEDSLQLVIISQDLNIKTLQKQIFQAGYIHVPYLMMSGKYGTDEVFKQERFFSDFDKTINLSFFKEGGVPHSVLFNREAQILYKTGGTVMNCDTIRNYTRLECVKK